MWLTCWHGRSIFCWCSLPSPRRTLSCWKQWSKKQCENRACICFWFFVFACLCSCEHESVSTLLRKWMAKRQDGREIVRKSRPICEKELSPLRRSVRICLQASFTPSFVNTFPLLSPLPIQPLNTQLFCCCTLPIFKLYGNVCLRCYPKDNTLLLVLHSKDRGWHTPEKNQLTGNLDIMKSSDFIPNAT